MSPPERARKSVSTTIRLPPAVADVLDRLTGVAGESREEKILAIIRCFFLEHLAPAKEPLIR